jgi:hypothetical protein
VPPASQGCCRRAFCQRPGHCHAFYEELFTDASLGALTSAVATTVLLVDSIIEIGFLKRFSTRYLVVLVAEGIVFLANLTTGNLRLKAFHLVLLMGCWWPLPLWEAGR